MKTYYTSYTTPYPKIPFHSELTLSNTFFHSAKFLFKFKQILHNWQIQNFSKNLAKDDMPILMQPLLQNLIKNLNLINVCPSCYIFNNGCEVLTDLGVKTIVEKCWCTQHKLGLVTTNEPEVQKIVKDVNGESYWLIKSYVVKLRQNR